MVLYGINGNIHCSWWPESGPTMYDGWVVLYGINGNVHVVGGPIVVRHCMLAEWCYMVLTAMYM